MRADQGNPADEATKIFGKDQPLLLTPGPSIEIIEIPEIPAA